MQMPTTPAPLSLVLLGATGDLARSKIAPALYALDCQGLLPRPFLLAGFGRTPLTDEAFRALLRGRLSCRYRPPASAERTADAFLAQCVYYQGDYGSETSFRGLAERLERLEGGRHARRVFYLATPPSVFAEAVAGLGRAGLARGAGAQPAPRLVVEKPFGSDRASSDELARALGAVFDEAHTYRIDHYLGKEVIQNLMVLRFANLIFEPLWNRDYVESVRIVWKEEAGIGTRGGSFDRVGIIRDVIQNHLLQILALATMEPPAAYEADAVRAEKVKLLKSVAPLALDDLVVGQYAAGADAAARPAYRAEPGVAADSRTPTFAAAAVRVRNRRWDGVPVLISAGKALDERLNEIRIRFRPVPGNIFCRSDPCFPPNELVLRVQPDEAVHIHIVSKMPGLELAMAQRALDLRYATAFPHPSPEAYERLLLDALVSGDRSLFISAAELAAAWDIVTPALLELERRAVVPLPYAWGSDGPAAAGELAARRLAGRPGPPA